MVPEKGVSDLDIVEVGEAGIVEGDDGGIVVETGLGEEESWSLTLLKSLNLILVDNDNVLDVLEIEQTRALIKYSVFKFKRAVDGNVDDIVESENTRKAC